MNERPTPTVRQLDADVHELYRLLEDVAAELRTANARLERQSGRLNQIEADLVRIEDKADRAAADTARTLAAIVATLDDLAGR